MKQWRLSLFLLLAAAPVLYVGSPLLHLFLHARWPDVWALSANPGFLQALSTSVSGALVTTALALVFGLPTAFALSILRIPGKRVFEGVLVLPLVLPPIVGGTAQLSLFGPQSRIGEWLQQLGIPVTDSLIGVVLAQSFVTSPFLILAAKAGFDAVPGELLEVTRLFGGTVWTQFLRVCIPISQSAIWAGALLTFTRAIGEFGATMMVAYHPVTIPVDIWIQFSSDGLAGVLPIAVALAIICLTTVAVTAFLRRSPGTGWLKSRT